MITLTARLNSKDFYTLPPRTVAVALGLLEVTLLVVSILFLARTLQGISPKAALAITIASGALLSIDLIAQYVKIRHGRTAAAVDAATAATAGGIESHFNIVSENGFSYLVRKVQVADLTESFVRRLSPHLIKREGDKIITRLPIATAEEANVTDLTGISTRFTIPQQGPSYLLFFRSSPQAPFNISMHVFHTGVFMNTNHKIMSQDLQDGFVNELFTGRYIGQYIVPSTPPPTSSAP